MLTAKGYLRKAANCKPVFTAQWGVFSGKITTFTGTKRGVINRLKKVNYIKYVDDLRITDENEMLVYGEAEHDDVTAPEWGSFFSQEEWTEMTGCILRTEEEVDAVCAEIERSANTKEQACVMIVSETEPTESLSGDMPTFYQVMVQNQQCDFLDRKITMVEAGLDDLQVESGTVRYDERLENISGARIIHKSDGKGNWSSELELFEDFHSGALFKGELRQTRIQAMRTLRNYIGRKTFVVESLLSKQLKCEAELLIRSFIATSSNIAPPLIETLKSGETVYLSAAQQQGVRRINQLLGALSIVRGQSLLAVECDCFVYTSTPRLSRVVYEKNSWVRLVTTNHFDVNTFAVHFTIAGLEEYATCFDVEATTARLINSGY